MSSVNQKRNTDSVITWFENIKNKNKYIYMQYDIEEFYPSISEDLLKKALDQCKNICRYYSSKEEETIMHC